MGEWLQYALSFVLVVTIPFAWKENNSWWFTIIKFYLFIAPFVFAMLGVLIVFTGPIYALYGFTHPEFLPVTIFYTYVITILVILDFLPQKYKRILETL